MLFTTYCERDPGSLPSTLSLSRHCSRRAYFTALYNFTKLSKPFSQHFTSRLPPFWFLPQKPRKVIYIGKVQSRKTKKRITKASWVHSHFTVTLLELKGLKHILELPNATNKLSKKETEYIGNISNPLWAKQFLKFYCFFLHLFTTRKVII